MQELLRALDACEVYEDQLSIVWHVAFVGHDGVVYHYALRKRFLTLPVALVLEWLDEPLKRRHVCFIGKLVDPGSHDRGGFEDDRHGHCADRAYSCLVGRHVFGVGNQGLLLDDCFDFSLLGLGRLSLDDVEAYLDVGDVEESYLLGDIIMLPNCVVVA